MASKNNQKHDTRAGQTNGRCLVDGYFMLSLSHRLHSLRWLGNWRASLMALKALVMPGVESMVPVRVPLAIEQDRIFSGRPGTPPHAVPPLKRNV